ncbi:hypothetical protein PG996_009743 [Apiospora saccharicola]|uniref:Uncharacterized protein n=1 Tax=Apiospora saccharicola TaxID=335842 RepID=A0ABR1ULM6_9PEZI
MVTCRIPVVIYIGCGCTVLDESRDPQQHQWPGHTCTKACPPFDIKFCEGLCEGARSKILFNDDLGSSCPGSDEGSLSGGDGPPSIHHEQAGSLKV